ncbi:hypothetical protein [Streptacidiphilus albus]|uniref:hypothetical protein n=1 Tax=Streptacidiphilus albus TaxID=105425 RepID=UPI00054B4E95|nr:hypothetical protein [Streptacidiphilus albus]
MVAAISRAADRRDTVVPDELDLIGGILTFPAPRQPQSTPTAPPGKQSGPTATKPGRTPISP